MSYPAKAIANYFINQSITENDKSLTLMKLLKLIYLAHGWSLAILERPLIDEPIEAWRYGPVVGNVYHALKHYGMRLINETIQDSVYLNNGVVQIQNYATDFDPKTLELLKKIWISNKFNTGIQLSNWSHDNKGPWHKTWYKATDNAVQLCSIGISDEEIKHYFKELGRANEERQAG